MNYLKSNIDCDFTKRVFLFIDEIQYLDNPSSFFKLFHDRYTSTVKLVVSGLSTFAIKPKFKDSLAGRLFSFELFGLDFEEFLWFKGIGYNLHQTIPDSVHPVLREYYKEYGLYGSYPKVVLTENIQKKELILKQIANTYVKNVDNRPFYFSNSSKMYHYSSEKPLNRSKKLRKRIKKES